MENPSAGNRTAFIKKHFLTILFAVLAVGLFLWGWLTIRSLKSGFDSERTALVDSFESRIDTLHLEGMERTAKVLSWAVRSEVSRNNIEQVNQFFLEFIRETSVSKAQYVDAETGEILISTDRKDEGTTILDPVVLRAEKQTVSQDSLHWRIATPVMGLNQKMGVLMIESPR